METEVPTLHFATPILGMVTGHTVRIPCSKCKDLLLEVHLTSHTLHKLRVRGIVFRHHHLAWQAHVSQIFACGILAFPDSEAIGVLASLGFLLQE